MIERVKGLIEKKGSNSVILVVNGIGLETIIKTFELHFELFFTQGNKFSTSPTPLLS